MSHIRKGGAWKALAPGTAIKKGGAWKDVSEIWIKKSGVWKLGWVAFAINAASISDDAIGPGTVSVGFTLNTDGTMDPVNSPSGSWGTPTTTGIGASYEVKASYSGTTKWGASAADGSTWYPLSSAVNFIVSDTASSVISSGGWAPGAR